MPPLALVGNLSRDVVDGGSPRIGGGPYYAARAWRALGTRGTIFTRCGPEDRRAYVRHLTALGLPVVSLEGTATTSFSFHYEGDTRIMTVDQPGDTWTPEDARVIPAGGWVHVAPLLRSDFPAATLAALAQGRHLSFDGQGLVRAAETGPLRLDAEFDPALLEHVQILKLAEVAQIADELDLPKGKMMAEEGDRGREFFVLLEGEADVTKSGTSINTIHGGDFFGEIALVTKMPRTASVTATSDVRVLVITERDFATLLKHSEEVGRGVAEALAERIAPDLPV